MGEILIVTGIGIVSAVAEMFLSSSGKAQEAKVVGIVAVSACLIVVIRMIGDLFQALRLVVHF